MVDINFSFSRDDSIHIVKTLYTYYHPTYCSVEVFYEGGGQKLTLTDTRSFNEVHLFSKLTWNNINRAKR